MSADKPDDTRTHDADFAAMWSSDGATRSLSPTASATGLPTDLPFLFSPGQRFGPYLIVRPLGKGGMGQVYEAEETESGRRIAMKILSRGLGDDEERQRFLNEGQLAASLSHPNCVYVFGTTEVQGFPVIAMELAPGGTLKEQVVDGKPLAPAAAVDAILQVVAGLDAAAALGILHRDIKPSNCFVDRDGRVLVGDFGLSMTTLARDEQTLAVAGTIMGTPGFASPEQLRGAPLDVRSDIYSVGATLYYLLTGRAPFDDENIATLITRVATETPPLLTGYRKDVPPRLASIVAKCLARTPGERPATYPALSAALEPFRSASLTPVSLGRRFLAGFVDNYVASMPSIPVNLYLGQGILDPAHRMQAALLALPGLAISIAYYGLLEGRFGCAAGKALLNLRVINEAQTAPGLRPALKRAAIFIVPTWAITFVVGAGLLWAAGPSAVVPGNVATAFVGLGSVATELVCLGILFSTARRANGFAALHDLVTGTRVVVRPQAVEARQAAARPAVAARLSAGDARIGPYVVAPVLKAQLPHVATAVAVDAYDDRLRRRVWLELLPIGTPAVPAHRRDLGRPARARWLSGRRSGVECWDAYEAVEGQGFLEVIARPQPWSRVRHWLADLANEMAAAAKDDSMPVLQPDRVWIGSDDRARLLDWPPPGARREERAPGGQSPEAQHFLYGIAAGALRGVDPGTAGEQPLSLPLPAPARALLLALRGGSFGSADAAAASASAVLRDPAAFPRRRRALQLAVCSMVPLVMVVSVFSALKWQIRSRTANPAAFALDACLKQLVALDKKDPSTLTAEQRQLREDVEIYVAEHLREGAADSAGYAAAFPGVASVQRQYVMAARALESHPVRTPEQVKKADEAVARLLQHTTASLEQLNRPVALWGVMALIAGGSAAAVALLGLIGALAARGGFTLRAFGASLVTANGSDASRLRALVRALIAWSPVLLFFVMVKVVASPQKMTAGAALLLTLVPAALLAGAVWAWRHPSRGIQDRIAGTWIVPR
jgi:eukaryotic-like serine/threonine-protein kinase